MMETFRKRLLAVLDYDGIQARKRAARIASACGCSPSTARRWLSVDGAAEKMTADILLNLACELGVEVSWLYFGDIERFHPRTFRIHAQQLKCYPKEETDQMTRLIVASYCGHRKARNLVNLVHSGQMTLLGAARLM
jgi:hypothetical protein